MDISLKIKGNRIRVRDDFGQIIDDIKEEDEERAGSRLANLLRKCR